MKIAKYLRISAATQRGRWRFQPTNSSSGGGSASAGTGLPNDFNAAVHGTAIWPVGKGANTSGWVGTRFIPTQSVINFQFAADNACTVYLNDVVVLSTDNWNYWGYATVNVIPGKEYALSVYVADYGGAYAVAGRVYYSDGTPAVKTSTSWVSA